MTSYGSLTNDGGPGDDDIAQVDLGLRRENEEVLGEEVAPEITEASETSEASEEPETSEETSETDVLDKSGPYNKSATSWINPLSTTDVKRSGGAR